MTFTFDNVNADATAALNNNADIWATSNLFIIKISLKYSLYISCVNQLWTYSKCNYSV